MDWIVTTVCVALSPIAIAQLRNHHQRINVIVMTVIGLFFIVLGMINAPPLPFYGWFGVLTWLIAFFRALGPARVAV
jgi:hypothetical protein